MRHALVEAAGEMEAWLLGIGNIALGALYSQYCDPKYDDFAQTALMQLVLPRTCQRRRGTQDSWQHTSTPYGFLNQVVEALMGHLLSDC